MSVKVHKKLVAQKKAPQAVAINVAGSDIKTAVGTVLAKHKDGATSEETTQEAVVYGPGPFASVGVRASRTFNLGDYNSVKVEVSLFIPSTMAEADIDESYQFASSWVDGKMSELSEKFGPEDDT